MDNCTDKSDSNINDIVESLSRFPEISFDILSALVAEMNAFKVSVSTALSYLNILNVQEDSDVMVYYHSLFGDVSSKKDIQCHYFRISIYGDNTIVNFNLNSAKYSFNFSDCTLDKQKRLYVLDDISKLKILRNWGGKSDKDLISSIKHIEIAQETTDTFVTDDD